MPTSKRADLSKVLPAVRCTARKRNGEPCKAMAARGANVCRVHGGSAPQVKAAAQRRLQNAADAIIERLLGFALDQGVPNDIALKAVIAAADRAGFKPGVEIAVTTPAYESIFEQLTGGSRAEHRNAQGIEDDPPPALVAANHDPIEVEVIDDLDDDGPIDVSYYVQPTTPEGDESSSVVDSGPFGPVSAPPTDGLMSLEDANAEIRRLRAQAATSSTRVHRAQRALPPGRSAR